MNNEVDINVLKNSNLQLEKTHATIEEQIAELVGYQNEDCTEQTENINSNQSKLSEDTENFDEKKVENSSDTRKHIENLMKIEYVTDKDEVNEGAHENPVYHEEVEDYEEQEMYTQIHENQLENTCRSTIDSEEEIYVDFKKDSKYMGDSSAQNYSDSNIHDKKEFLNSDDDFQYDTKHLLDVKKVKVLHECSICQYTTTHMGILRKHISTLHNSKTMWKCKHCCKKFGSKVLLLKHVRKEHSKRSRKCPYCLCIILCNGKAMKKHIKNIHPSECLSRVPVDKNKPELTGLTRNGSRGMYRCNKCSYSNRCLGVMLSHIKMHSMKHVLKCLYCHYMVNQRKLYRIHLSGAHKLAKKIYICSRCFFQSEDQDEYAEHFYEPHMYHNCALCDFKTHYIETFYLHAEMHENSEHDSENSPQVHEQLNKNGEELKHDEIIAEDEYSRKDVDDCDFIIKNTAEGTNSEEQKNNIEFENVDCLDVENRRATETVQTKYYSQKEVNGVTIFSCLKCDFISNSSSSYEICEHLMNVHSICSKKGDMGILKKGENEVEFVQLEGEPDPANRYVIEPTVTNLPTQTCNKMPSSFVCEHCDFTAPTIHTKILHDQKTHNATHFKCPTPSCSFEANDGEVFIDHFKNHMDLNQQVLSCPFCELEIDNEISLKYHVDIEHLDIIEESSQDSTLDDENIIKPSSVFDKTRIETASPTHEKKIGEVYQCDLCFYNAPDLTTLESHQKIDHSTESLKCPRCFQNQFSNVREFWDHLNQHCPQCRFQSSDPNKIRLHVLTHVPKYKRYDVGVSTSRLKPCVNSNMLPEQRDKILDELRECSISEISDLELSRLHGDELEQENDFGEEIRIIFEDSLHEDESSLELSNCENDQMKIAIDDSNELRYCDVDLANNHSPITNNDYEDSFDSRKKVSKRKQQEQGSDRSSVNNYEYKSISVKKFALDSNKKLIDKPVRIIKIPEFQCFDCLNIYKTRYTLVDHRKRLHGLKKPHSCTYCMEIFETYSYLKSHYYRIHRVSFHYKGPIFKCPLCEYNSINLKQTKKHIMKTHQRTVAGFQKRGVVY